MTVSQPDLLALAHRVNQLAAERFAAFASDTDLTIRQLQVLAAIDSHQGGTQTDVVRATGIDRSTLTEMIRRLASRKLVERRRSRRDARANAVRLTTAGRQALDAGAPALKHVEKSLMADLSASEQSTLVALLARVASSTAPLR